MSQSNSSNHQFPLMISHEPLFSKTEHLQNEGLSLSSHCAFQPTTDTRHLGRYKVFKVLPNDRKGQAQLKAIVNMLQDRWLTVGYDHHYISPTWSVSVDVRGLTVPAIVTPYYRNRNALEYLRLHPSTDCLDIICQAANALAYIHSKCVVHGNVCPGNICIADNGTVRLTDVGVDTHVREASNRYKHSVPANWMYKPGEEVELGIRTTQTDVYSFAVTSYSFYTLRSPFPSQTHSYGKGLSQIVIQGHDGIFGNSKPTLMCGELWDIIRTGWATEPSQRPSMPEMERKLKSMRLVM